MIRTKFFSSKTNVLLNLIKNQQSDTDKIYLYIKDPFEPKHRLLINMKIYENLEDCNLTKKMKVLIVFADGIADMEANKNLSRIVTDLF